MIVDTCLLTMELFLKMKKNIAQLLYNVNLHLKKKSVVNKQVTGVM